ncbi:pollen Ole e 1 allergen/extensin family protein, partial [Clostridium perfringens]|nr:pollen Ole e 1 allergen/extensin family protein [Clostridium perfringens]
MAKNYGVAAIVAALCLVGVVHCVECLTVEGPVYCDTCRVDFPTPLSYDLKGAKVKVECRNKTTNEVTVSIEGATDGFGWYRIPVEGDHEEELCEVSLLDSGDETCSELLEGAVHNARVALTNRNGISHQTARFA